MTLDDYLTIWAEWMTVPEGPEREPAVASGFVNARTNFYVAEEDSNTQADDREASYGPIVDACIESMAPHERLAIHHVFGFSRTVRTLTLNAGIVYTECRPRLARMIAARLPLDETFDVAYPRLPSRGGR